MPPDTLIIIPTYNEAENIEELLRAIFQLQPIFHVLVVDDGSPDGTASKVKALQAEFPGRLFLEVRNQKSGLGTAYLHGFRWALEREYAFICQMDADFSHNPQDLPRLCHACRYENVQVAIGSRYVKGVNVVNWPLSRILLSYGASLYVQLITGMPLRDPTAGFVCYRREVMQALCIQNSSFVGYAFQIELKFRAFLKKYNLVEIPIIFIDRTRGVSKMSGKIIYEAIFGVITMKFKSLFKKTHFWKHEPNPH